MSNAQPLPPNSQSHAGRSLSLDVGEVSSSCSSTPSIPSLFDDGQPPPEEFCSLQSSISLPPTVNVKFAPLPKIGPRDRRSARPLGVAARSRMLQQRRDIRMQQQPRVGDDHPMEFIPDEVHEDDPLEVLGRFIAAKSRSLWRRVAPRAETGVVGETTTTGEGERKVVHSRPPNGEASSDPPNKASGISENNTSRMLSQDSS